jgi:hypothetical protein
MKIRNGFVSNSSSSSFICEICGHTEIGYDDSASDLGFAVCVNEHIFCEEHLLKDEKEDSDDYGEVYSEECCPICQFEMYSQPELARYLLETYAIPRDTVFQEIRAVNKRRKKLYDFEYIEYVFKQNNLTDDIVLKQLKDTFGTYKNFIERTPL